MSFVASQTSQTPSSPCSTHEDRRSHPRHQPRGLPALDVGYPTSDSPKPKQTTLLPSSKEPTGKTSSKIPLPPGPSRNGPQCGLGWSQAKLHPGTVQRVCGPLMSVRETEDGTSVNIGQDYPSADRFTFIFWIVFLGPNEPRTTNCGSGEIYP